LAEWLRQIDVVRNALGNVEVVPGNARVNQVGNGLALLIFPEVAGRVFERVFQLLPGQLQSHECIFIFIQSRDVAHRHLAFGDVRAIVEACGHGNISIAGLELYPLDEIYDCRIAKAATVRGQGFT
jgi:hypothetical protein